MYKKRIYSSINGTRANKRIYILIIKKGLSLFTIISRRQNQGDFLLSCPKESSLYQKTLQEKTTIDQSLLRIIDLKIPH